MLEFKFCVIFVRKLSQMDHFISIVFWLLFFVSACLIEYMFLRMLHGRYFFACIKCFVTVTKNFGCVKFWEQQNIHIPNFM